MMEIPFRHFARYSEIISILIRYGLGYFVLEQIPLPKGAGLIGSKRHYSEAELTLIGVRLREALTELGPTFIKMGQLVGNRTDIIPQPVAAELTKLQDRVRPFPFVQVRQVIEQALQQRLDAAFQEFDPRPLAAASLGQVHQAVLYSGEKAAVKVQRPRVREVAEVDLEIFSFLISKFEQRTEWGKRYPLKTIFNEFSKTLLEELDFFNEGRNTEQLARLNRKNSNFVIPKIYWEFTKATVLTQEFISGIPLHQMIDDQDLSIKGEEYDRSLIAKQLGRGLLRQILSDGYFHGDPHPGNIFILPEGKIALIDFGVLGTLTQSMRYQLAELIMALLRGKDERLFEVISQMGIVPQQIDQTQFLKDISGLRSKYLNQSQGIRGIGEGVQDFFNLIHHHGIYLPSEFILVGKTLITLEGYLYRLDPEFSLIEQVKPYSRKILWDRYNPIHFLTRILSFS
ncbi:ABC1 kinase family protein [Desulfitobacterium sp. Sab5]|uniref:ABC1 kinase family protein n=1 Tax=Desulfitobacterium nosdiversum TaxID=3375356 RepID=UPI003CF5F889